MWKRVYILARLCWDHRENNTRANGVYKINNLRLLKVKMIHFKFESITPYLNEQKKASRCKTRISEYKANDTPHFVWKRTKKYQENDRITNFENKLNVFSKHKSLEINESKPSSFGKYLSITKKLTWIANLSARMRIYNFWLIVAFDRDRCFTV